MFSKLFVIAIARALAADATAHPSGERPMMRSAKKHGHHRWPKIENQDGVSVAESGETVHHSHYDREQHLHRRHRTSGSEKYSPKNTHHRYHSGDGRTPFKSDRHYEEHRRHHHPRDSIHHADRSHSHMEDEDEEPEEEVERILWQNRGRQSEASEEELDAEERHKDRHGGKHKSKLQPGTMSLDMNAHGEMRKASVMHSQGEGQEYDGHYHAIMDGGAEISTGETDTPFEYTKVNGLDFGMYNYQDRSTAEALGWTMIENKSQFEEDLGDGKSLWDHFKEYYNKNDGIRVIKTFQSQNCCLSFGNDKRLSIKSHYCYPLLAENKYALNDRIPNTKCNPADGYSENKKWKWNYPNGGLFEEDDTVEEDEIHCASKNNPGIFYTGTLLQVAGNLDSNSSAPPEVKSGARAIATNAFMGATTLSVVAASWM